MFFFFLITVIITAVLHVDIGFLRNTQSCVYEPRARIPGYGYIGYVSVRVIIIIGKDRIISDGYTYRYIAL